MRNFSTKNRKEERIRAKSETDSYEVCYLKKNFTQISQVRGNKYRR